jgi:hypothetical protein
MHAAAVIIVSSFFASVVARAGTAGAPAAGWAALASVGIMTDELLVVCEVEPFETFTVLQNLIRKHETSEC